ncbi:MAG: bifunctional acetate--CoA ligase family protein/GNAT family N-acetyltransferase [Bacteroidetes bacterium]|nr:bifunctional acetate--CoA ligase family protein/GNAT family N-acetyltransferase [Bacteroidota bacterium]
MEPRQVVTSPLEAILNPRTVAVIGATNKPGTVGRTVLWNLLNDQFHGTVFPVNPRQSNVLGIKAYPTVAAIGEPVDLAVIITPAAAVPQIVGECAASGVKGCVIISGGFKEVGPAGEALEREILERVSDSGMRIVGPNCFGVMNPLIGLNATFAAGIARAGNVGFITQSGALGAAVLDWSFRENVGYSSFVSVGSMLDVDWSDLINYFGNDPHTESIVVYMESIGNARSFMSAARSVTHRKPIIVIKPGRTEAASRAAASHTGSLSGSDDVLDAAFRRCGVVRVAEISDLFHLSEVLAKQPRPQGPRLTILTNAGGPGVLATDALVASGGVLAELSEFTRAKLDAILPPHWSHANPIDILGDASAERYSEVLSIIANDPASDGLLVIVAPQAMIEPTDIAERLKPYARINGKPVLACWMGGRHVEPGIEVLNRANIPTFGYPDEAARMFTMMWRYSDNLRALYETPTRVRTNEEAERSAHEHASRMLSTIRASGRELLSEYESKQLLVLYDIPVVKTEIATTVEQAVDAAHSIGYPVVLKLHSHVITHKTDVGGVRLNLESADAVRRAFVDIRTAVSEHSGNSAFAGVTVQPMIRNNGYELIVGSTTDAQFGPVLLFGTGGQLVEVFKDRSLALPPLNTTLARLMMERTKIYDALKGVRGRTSVDLQVIEELLVRFSYLVTEQTTIKEIDINPLLVSADGLLALDARVVLHGPSINLTTIPPTAIRPYPSEYISHWITDDGQDIVFRPIRPEDELAMVEFHASLSDRSVVQRFLQPMNLRDRVAHERLSKICFPDYDLEMPLIACRHDGRTGTETIMCVARMSKSPDGRSAEIHLIVGDPFQHQGIGGEALSRLTSIAKNENIRRLYGYLTAGSTVLEGQCQALGFDVSAEPDGDILVTRML